MSVSIEVLVVKELVLEDSISCNLLKSLSQVISSDPCVHQPSNGFVCIGCDLLATCVKQHDKWEAIPVELCDTSAGYSCNMIEGSCSNKTGPCKPINNGAFSCTSAGTFPDPFDCQSYHVCYKNGNQMISIDITCDAGVAFNPFTGDCSLTLNAEVCHKEGFSCKKAGDMGPWLHNPNFFYICKADFESGEKIIYPELYKCEPNSSFVKDECVKNGLTTQKPLPGVECSKPGVFEDVTSCKHYIYCNKELVGERFECPENTYFNTKYLSCVRGSC
ncbi:uncharacterized protein LOC134837872 [Culicoides brevitarsis]|uniref:uncharacterized protein LOC134837872 n=1 Tax=Culicoides brevitarsis TaxID=469753 RepID=UPI00307BAF70